MRLRGLRALERRRDKRPATIAAHRGANKLAPENTLPAIEQAMQGRIGTYVDVKDAAPGDLLRALAETGMLRTVEPETR